MNATSAMLRHSTTAGDWLVGSNGPIKCPHRYQFVTQTGTGIKYTVNGKKTRLVGLILVLNQVYCIDVHTDIVIDIYRSLKEFKKICFKENVYIFHSADISFNF